MAISLEAGSSRAKSVVNYFKDNWKNSLTEMGVGAATGLVVRGSLRWGCEGAMQCVSTTNPVLATCIGAAGGAAVALSKEYFIKQRTAENYILTQDNHPLVRRLHSEMNYIASLDKGAIGKAALRGAAFGALGGLTGPILGEIIAANTDKFAWVSELVGQLKEKAGNVIDSVVKHIPVTEVHAAIISSPQVTVESSITPTPTPTATVEPTSTPTPKPTFTPEPTSTPTVTPTLIPTPETTVAPEPPQPEVTPNNPRVFVIPEADINDPQYEKISFLNSLRGAVSVYDVDANTITQLKPDPDLIGADLAILQSAAPVENLVAPITVPIEPITPPIEQPAPVTLSLVNPEAFILPLPEEPIAAVVPEPEVQELPKILSFEERLALAPVELELIPGSTPWESAREYLRAALGREPTPMEIMATAKELCKQSGIRVDEWGLKEGVNQRALRPGFKLVFNQTVKDSIGKASKLRL